MLPARRSCPARKDRPDGASLPVQAAKGGSSGHRRDEIADVADLVRAEHGAIDRLQFQEIGSLYISASQHASHARHLLGMECICSK